MAVHTHRIGIIGAGFQARNLAEAAGRVEGLEIGMISADGRESASLLGAHLDVPVAADADTVIANSTIDLVVVATPNQHHASLAAQALDAGKKVFVEKPVALNQTGIDALARRTVGRRTDLIVGHALRTAPGIRRLLDSALTGQIGPVLSVDAVRARVLTRPAGALGWKHDPMRSGGELIHELHELDLACLLGGTVESVRTMVAHHPTEAEDPALRHSLIAFGNGTIAHHVISAHSHAGRWTLTVSGGDASLHADLRAGVVTRVESGVAIEEWPIFMDPAINDSLVASSVGPARHNTPGAGASPWMASLAEHEMTEVARILNGAEDSILLRQPFDAVRTALALLEQQASEADHAASE